MNRRLYFLIPFFLLGILTWLRQPMAPAVVDSRGANGSTTSEARIVNCFQGEAASRCLHGNGGQRDAAPPWIRSRIEEIGSTPSFPFPKLDHSLRERISNAIVTGNDEELSVMVVLSVQDDFVNRLASAFPDETENYVFRPGYQGEQNLLRSARALAIDRQKRLVGERVKKFLSENRHYRSKIRNRLGLAPMFSLSATPQEILKLAKDPEVQFIESDFPIAKRAGERTASQARFSTVWNTDGYDGTGVNVGLVEEDDIPFPALTGPDQPLPAPLAIFDPDSTTNHAHATDVAGVIWSRDPIFRGLASGSNPYFATASTDSGRAAAVDWCIQQGCSVMNLSWGTPAGQNDGNLKWLDLYHDWVTEINRVLIVAAAGNDGLADGRVISPGNGFNVLTVGMINGGDPNTWSDDEVSSSSNHVDPATGAMKPEIVNYGVNIKSLSASPPYSQVSSGTSFATPVVTSAAALCVQANPDSTDEPMTLKAQLMASAVVHDFPGTDRDGVGVAMAQAYRAATSSRTIYRNNDDNLEWTVSLKGGVKNRIVLCYPHRPIGTTAPDSNTFVDNGNSYHRIDLDFEVFVAGNRVGFSGNEVNQAFELLDYTPPGDTEAVVKITKWDWPINDPRDSLRIGLAHGSSDVFGTGPDQSNDDRFEPNDSAVQASALEPHETQSGLLSTDEDWFSLAVPPNTTTTARIDFLNATGDLELLARKPGASAEIRSESSDDFETVTFSTGSEAETWNLAVYAYFPEQNRASYNLTIRSDFPPQAPQITAPENDSETTTTPRLECSVPVLFPSDSEPSPVAESEWQISESIDFSSLHFQLRSNDVDFLNVPDGALSGETTYHARVRHIDAEGKKSLWSDPHSFHTRSVPVFPSPSIQSNVTWSGSSATISWDAATSATSYEIRSSTDGPLVGVTTEPQITLPASRFKDDINFRITAVNGPSKSEESDVSVELAARKVDGQIGLRKSKLRGNNRYNRSGRGQTVRLTFSRRSRVRFYFRGENDSAAPDIVRFQISRGRRGLHSRILRQSPSRRNITASISRGRYESKLLFPGQNEAFQVQLRLSSRKRRQRQTLRVHQFSLINSQTANPALEVIRDTTAAKLRR